MDGLARSHAASCWHQSRQSVVDSKSIKVVLRDVSKAFDKVWHVGLKYKIQNLNLQPSFTKILYSFLTNRKASISLPVYIGEPFPLNSGVP